MDDGISLTSTAHPRSRWWWLRALVDLVRPPRFNPDSLETIEIEVKGDAGHSSEM